MAEFCTKIKIIIIDDFYWMGICLTPQQKYILKKKEKENAWYVKARVETSLS